MIKQRLKIKRPAYLILIAGFLFLPLLYSMPGTAEAAKRAPSVLLTPTSGVIVGDSGTKIYKVTITNNDDASESSSTFNVSINSQTLIPLGNTSFNTGSTSVGTDCNAVALSPGQRCNTTLTVTTLTITNDDKLRVVVQATEAAHATGKGSVVTKAAASKGDGNLLKRAEEETCHACHKTDRNRTPSDADWADAIKSHSSTSLSSTKWGASGWGVAGGKYGEFVCTTCHTGHSTTNIYLIKETITTPDGSDFVGRGTNSVTVNYRYKATQPTGTPGTMGDDSDTIGHVSSNRICEVCHTYDSGQTTGVNKHAYNMSTASPQNPGHYNAEGCTTCHDHKKSFSGAGGTCNSCHGAPVGSGSDNNAPAQYKASHEKHYNPAAGVPTSYTDTSIASTTATYVFKCGRCHSDNSANHTANSDGTVDVLLPLDGGTFSPGSYAGGDNPPPPGSVTFKNSSGTCSNVYCHGNFAGSGLNATPTWGGTVNCGSCHGASAASPPSGGSHNKHANSSYYSFGCQLCHNATTTDGTSIADKTVHVDKKSNWSISTSDIRTNGGTYNSLASGSKSPPSTTYSSCANVYCHSTGTSNNSPYPAPNITPAWGGSLDATCTGCHNGYSGATSKMSSGSHTAHINNSSILGSNYSCQICHSATASGNTAIWQYSSHTNKEVDVDFTALNPSAAYTGLAIPGDPYGNCNNVYCHSNGKVGTTVEAYVNRTWGEAGIGCNGCHGTSTTAGTPDYANAGAGTVGANSHLKHTKAGTSTCVYCHNSTTVTGTTIISGSTKHTDGTRDVENGGGKSFSWAAQTCSTISCHGSGSGSAQWGATLNCSDCHSSLSGAHGTHVGNLVSAGLAAYGDLTNNSNSGSYRFNCGNCHPTSSANHADGTVQVDLTPSGSGLKSKNDPFPTTGGVSPAITCSKIYCHSNGAGGAKSNLSSAQSPAWDTTLSGNKCGSCHENPPQYPSAAAGTAGANSHYNASNFMGKEGGHMITIHRDNMYNKVSGSGLIGLDDAASADSRHGNPNVATTMACYVCHSGIISSTTIDTYAMYGTASSFKCSTCHTAVTTTQLQAGAIADKSLHVNGSANVVFAAITMRSKAQLRDASKPATWTRNGTYGVSGSYDSAALNGTWNSGPRTCTTACHNGGSATWGDTTVTCYSCHTSL